MRTEQRRIALLVHTTTHTRLRHYYHCQHHHHHQHHDGGGWLLIFMHILFNFIIIVLCHSERTFCVRRRCGDVLWRRATALHSHITTAYNDIIYIIMTVMCRDKSFDNSILPFIMYLFYHQPTCCRCIRANGEIAGKLIDEKFKQNILRNIVVLAGCWWLQSAHWMPFAGFSTNRKWNALLFAHKDASSHRLSICEDIDLLIRGLSGSYLQSRKFQDFQSKPKSCQASPS